MVALAILWWIYFGAGIYLEDSAISHQAWWLDVWHGGLGGNGFSAFGATVLGIVLTVEVGIIMFTLAGNRRRIKEAAERAAREAAEEAAKNTEEAVRKAVREAVERTRKEDRQEWLDWLELVRDDLDSGHPPSVPPPAGANGADATRG